MMASQSGGGRGQKGSDSKGGGRGQSAKNTASNSRGKEAPVQFSKKGK